MVHKKLSLQTPVTTVTFTQVGRSSIQGNYGHWSAILNADEDLDGEVAMVGAGWLGIYDPDGTELSRRNAGTGQPRTALCSGL